MIFLPAVNDKAAVKEILIDTLEVKDAISFTWRIANFSKMNKKYPHNLKTQFSLTSNSTTWTLKLNETSIDLNRIDNGETVYCDFKVSLVTHGNFGKTYENQQFHKFDKLHSSITLLVLERPYENKTGILKKAPLEFQEDVFKLRFNMKISGPIINKISQPAGYLKLKS